MPTQSVLGCHLKPSLEKEVQSIMQTFHFFWCFSFAYIFNILCIQGIDIRLLTDRVYNKTANGVATRQMFKEFVKTHNRTYVDDPEEYRKRFAVFKVHIVLICSCVFEVKPDENGDGEGLFYILIINHNNFEL